VIGAAVMVGRIATGEIDETATTDDGKTPPPSPPLAKS
jgi:hypothetical protein